MSIKRTREVSRRRPSDGGGLESKKEADRVYKWEEDVVPRLGEVGFAYAASHCYAKDSVVEHAVFGKGLVTRVEGAKIEVLFQAGPKKLVHNPKGAEAPKAGAPAAPAPAAEASAAVPAAPEQAAAPAPSEPPADKA